LSVAGERGRGQGWPQATAGGGAQRPWGRRRAARRSWSGRVGARWASWR